MDRNDALKKNAQFEISTAESKPNFCSRVLIGLSYLLTFITFPFSLLFCLIVINEYQRVIIFRLGRLRERAAGPGLFFILPCIDTYRVVDLRTITFDVPPQEILTKDSVTVSVDAVVYYHVENATKAIVNVHNFSRSTQLLAAITLRNMLGMHNLSGILCERETIANVMKIHLSEATYPWGVQVERIDIRDVRLPYQLQRAMAAEAEADREARAKVVAADGERDAAHALNEAAMIMDKSTSALQLRYLQTLNSIAAEKNSTIVFPLPMQLLQSLTN